MKGLRPARIRRVRLLGIQTVATCESLEHRRLLAATTTDVDAEAEVNLETDADTATAADAVAEVEVFAEVDAVMEVDVVAEAEMTVSEDCTVALTETPEEAGTEPVSCELVWPVDFTVAELPETEYFLEDVHPREEDYPHEVVYLVEPTGWEFESVDTNQPKPEEWGVPVWERPDPEPELVTCWLPEYESWCQLVDAQLVVEEMPEQVEPAVVGDSGSESVIWEEPVFVESAAPVYLQRGVVFHMAAIEDLQTPSIASVVRIEPVSEVAVPTERQSGGFMFANIVDVSTVASASRLILMPASGEQTATNRRFQPTSTEATNPERSRDDFGNNRWESRYLPQQLRRTVEFRRARVKKSQPSTQPAATDFVPPAAASETATSNSQSATQQPVAAAAMVAAPVQAQP